jgi:hypothetical protein
MEVITSDEVRRQGMPGGAHVLELVTDASECAVHPHYMGVECLPVRDIGMVKDRFAPQEPILIHAQRPESYTVAAAELDRLGYRNVFAYQGDLQELQSFMGAREEAPRISQSELDALLTERAERVRLINVAGDPGRCAMMVGVRCVNPAGLHEILGDVGRANTIVLRCEPDIDCQTLARATNEAGFDDVRVFEGNYQNISWLKRL